MHARLRGSKSLLTLYQIVNKPDFPSLADEIAEPHPDIVVSKMHSNEAILFFL